MEARNASGLLAPATPPVGSPRAAIDLARGELPASAAVSLARDVDWRQVLERGFGYAPPAGSHRLRTAFVTHLARVARSPGDVLVTHGALGALDLALCMRPPGSRMFASDPTYREAIGLAHRNGVRPAPIHRDGPELDVERLRAELGPDDVVYLVPSLNNPDGHTLPARTRELVAEAVARSGAALLEDDAYRHLDPEGETAPSVTELVVRLRPSAAALRFVSFSKTVAPGARTCVVEGSRPGVRDLLAAKADFGTGPIASELVAGVLDDPVLWSGTLGAVARRLDDGRRAALDALAGWPGGVTDPGGGYFLWLPLGAVPSATFTIAARRDLGVVVADGTPFSVTGSGPSHVRVSVGWEDADVVAVGAARLLRCWERLQEMPT